MKITGVDCCHLAKYEGKKIQQLLYMNGGIYAVVIDEDISKLAYINVTEIKVAEDTSDNTGGDTGDTGDTDEPSTESVADKVRRMIGK